jgi:antitoxin ParD1/3/4
LPHYNRLEEWRKPSGEFVGEIGFVVNESPSLIFSSIPIYSKACYYWLHSQQQNGGSMNVSLTNQLESYVKQKVATGMYNSVSEVVREALRLMAAKDSLDKVKLESLRQDIHQGLAALDTGAGKVFDMAEIKAKAQAQRVSQ